MVSRSLFDTPELRRFALFLCVGAVNTAFGYAAFAALIVTGMGTPAATAGSTLLGALFNFRSFGSIVFRSSERRLLPRFLAFYGLQWPINVALLGLLAAAGFGPLLAQAILVPFLAISSFVVMRRFIFPAAPADELPT